MTTSMTGFGRGQQRSGGIKVEVETKSVNSRHLDISIRMPQTYQTEELELKELIQAYAERGKITIYVRIDESERGIPDVTFNSKLAKGYANLLKQIKEVSGLKQEVGLSDLLSFEDILQSREEDEETKKLTFGLIKDALEDSLINLNEMRRQEGKQLDKDLRTRLAHIEQSMDSIKQQSVGRISAYRDKLHERIETLLSDNHHDAERLEQEIAIVADKIDITEEVVRLDSHIKFFYETLERDQPIGRRLNFLLQEMNREINTIGSKANDSEISQEAVYVKENLEKLREQVQNIE